VEGYEGHLEKLEGGYTVAFEHYTADADLTPFFAGLRPTASPAVHPPPARARRRPQGPAAVGA